MTSFAQAKIAKKLLTCFLVFELMNLNILPIVMKTKIGIVLFLWLLQSHFLWAQDDQIALANEYFAQQEYEKALSIYQKLANSNAVLTIHDNYWQTLQKLNKYEEAEKYLKKQVKRNPTEAVFNVDYGLLLRTLKKENEANTHFQNYIKLIEKEDNLLRLAARKFINANLHDYAEQVYLAGRKNGKDQFIYELAALYSISGDIEKMMGEYLSILSQDESRVEYVQNFLSGRLRDEAEWAKVESILLKYVQQEPDKIIFSDMLLWYYLQQKKFYKAFMQVKALDKRQKLGGQRIYEIGVLAFKNQEYDHAITIFEYIVENYKRTIIGLNAKQMLTASKEELIKNTYPVDLQKIRELIDQYKQIYQESGINLNGIHALRSQALLYGFYLNEKDSAQALLEAVLKANRLDPETKARTKMDLGDIYILKNEPWEAALLYGQVEKEQKNELLGQEAKLKNAKLSYYKGEFELSKGHLDILKLATSREIANDAMSLSLLIGDNLDLDTTEAPLRAYADIDLMVFQNRYEEALKAYDKMLVDFPNHSLSDEIFWSKSQILLKLGRFSEAMKYLERILSEHKEDIWADDANFTMGKIYQDYLKNKEKAMEYFQKQLLEFQGSTFNVEARKRFRMLRGDQTN